MVQRGTIDPLISHQLHFHFVSEPMNQLYDEHHELLDVEFIDRGTTGKK